MKELHITVSWDDAAGYYIADVVEPAGSDNALPRPAAGFPCPLAPGKAKAFLENLQDRLLAQIPGDDIAVLLETRNEAFQFLFCRTIGGAPSYNTLGEHWRACWMQARTGDEGLRTVLHLDPQRPELLAAPWELMRHPDGFSPARWLVPGTNKPHILTRAAWKVSDTAPPLVTLIPGEPLRVLLVLGSDDPAIRAAEEALDVDLALSRLHPWQVDLHVLKLPDLRAITDWCRQWQPHVLHFVGHGNVEAGEGRLLLEQRPTAAGAKAPAIQLGSEQVTQLFGVSVPRLVVLNACRSGETYVSDKVRTQAEAARGFSESLIRYGVPAVIAMQGDIQGVAAALMMSSFYDSLVAGEPVDSALAQARDAAYKQSSNSWDWSLPALYVPDAFNSSDLLRLRPNLGDVEGRVFAIQGGRLRREHRPEDVLIPVAVRCQVGYDDERRALEAILTQATDRRVPRLTVVTAPRGAGKTSLAWWLVERCLRRDRPVIYADLRGGPDFWTSLARVRDGCLKPDQGAAPGPLPGLAHPDLVFRHFNYNLNTKTINEYAANNPEPGKEQPVAGPYLDSSVPARLAACGTVGTEDPAKLLSDAFWDDLVALSQPTGSLLMVLDDGHEMESSQTDQLHKYLLVHALERDENDQFKFNIHVVVMRQPRTWTCLDEPLQNPQLAREIRLGGFPGADVKWMASIWAQRFFLRHGGLALVRAWAEESRHELTAADVSCLIEQNRQQLSPSSARYPEVIVRHLTGENVVLTWLDAIS